MIPLSVLHKILLIITGSGYAGCPGEIDDAHITAVLLIRILHCHTKGSPVRLTAVSEDTAAHGDHRSLHAVLFFQILSCHIAGDPLSDRSPIQRTACTHGD